MAKHVVTSRIKWKGKHREAGATLDLDDETAAPLLDAGVIAAPSSAKAAGGEPAKPAKDESGKGEGGKK